MSQSSICGFCTTANNEDILRGEEETGSEKAHKLRHKLNFVRMQSTENWGQIPRDQRKSHKIRANVNPRGRALHKSNTATNFFIRDGRVAAWQSQVGKSHTGEKSTLRPISIDQPMFFTWPRRAAPAFWLFECRRRFGAISPNLTSAAEESGLIPAEMECGLSCPAPEGKEDLKSHIITVDLNVSVQSDKIRLASSRAREKWWGSEKPHHCSTFERQ